MLRVVIGLGLMGLFMMVVLLEWRVVSYLAVVLGRCVSVLVFDTLLAATSDIWKVHWRSMRACLLLLIYCMYNIIIEMV